LRPPRLPRTIRSEALFAIDFLTFECIYALFTETC
jgi:hypothetical protein